MSVRVWRCRRQQDGIVCGELNLLRFTKCRACGKRRPATKKPAHRAILDEMSYEQFVETFIGDGPVVCMICGRPPAPGKKLHRDHAHSGPIAGHPRGLLDWSCNRLLPPRIDAAWLRAAADYLDAAEARVKAEAHEAPRAVAA